MQNQKRWPILNKLIQHNILHKYPVWQPTQKIAHGPSIDFKFQNMVHGPCTIVMYTVMPCIMPQNASLMYYMSTYILIHLIKMAVTHSNSMTIQLLITVDDHQLDINSICVHVWISLDMSNCYRYIGILYFISHGIIVVIRISFYNI